MASPEEKKNNRSEVFHKTAQFVALACLANSHSRVYSNDLWFSYPQFIINQSQRVVTSDADKFVTLLVSSIDNFSWNFHNFRGGDN